MAETLAAYTKLGTAYPGYINLRAFPDGSVQITMRGDPDERPDSCYICGHDRDRGKPGRCTPGDENCNNYCNMAPEKGPMAQAPKSTVQYFEGETVRLMLSAEEWRDLVKSIQS